MWHGQLTGKRLVKRGSRAFAPSRGLAAQRSMSNVALDIATKNATIMIAAYARITGAKSTFFC